MLPWYNPNSENAHTLQEYLAFSFPPPTAATLEIQIHQTILRNSGEMLLYHTTQEVYTVVDVLLGPCLVVFHVFPSTRWANQGIVGERRRFVYS
jgi:hypothetical protein